MFPATPYAKTRLHLALAAAGLCALHAPVMATEDGSEGALSKVFVKATVEKKKLGDSVSGGALGRKSELDTPFSTKAVSSDEIEDRLATSISEVLKYDASVTAISPPISTHPATIQMRGLRLDDLNGYKINGLAAVNRGTEMPLEMFESVEVLKGLSGLCTASVRRAASSTTSASADHQTELQRGAGLSGRRRAQGTLRHRRPCGRRRRLRLPPQPAA
jgi:iron complex outermembrane receptor protein